MGTFSRLRYVIAANVNSMLERAENPEKLLRALVREMEEARDEARAASSEFLAEESTIKRQMENCQEQLAHWNKRAELAVEEGRDDLARAALITRGEYQQKLENLNGQHQEAKNRLQQIKGDMNTLNEKLNKAKQVLQEISKKPVKAKASGPRAAIPQSPHDRKINRAFSRFERLEAQVDNLEARVNSYEFVPVAEDPWKELEQPGSEQLEKELQALKAKLGKPAVAVVEHNS